MKPEQELADLVKREAEARGLNYFLVTMNPQTGQFSYRTLVVTGNAQIAATVAHLKALFAAAGAKPA